MLKKLGPDIRLVVAAGIAATLTALGADAAGIASDVTDGDWGAVHTLLSGVVVAGYTAVMRAITGLLTNAFPPQK